MNDFGTFTKLPKNVRDSRKLIIAKGFKKLPKVLKIAKSGHTGRDIEQLQWNCNKELTNNCRRLILQTLDIF